MEKVWFKLRQTDYPPGPEETILAGSGDDTSAPICLGHFVSDLKHIDFPINSGRYPGLPGADESVPHPPCSSNGTALTSPN